MTGPTPDDEAPTDPPMACTSDADHVVSWTITPTDTHFGRLCAYALTGTLGGFLLLALGLLGISVVGFTASANVDVLVVVGILVLFGGPLSVHALISFLDPDQRPDDLGAGFSVRALHPVGVVASAVLGAAGIFATFASETVLSIYPMVGVLFVASMGLALGGPSGRVDRHAGTLTVDENAHPLADLASVRALDVGGLVLVQTRFVASPGGRDAPFLFTMPRDAHDSVRDALDAGVAADSTVDASPSRGDRIATAIAGIGAFAFAAALVALGATSSVDGAEVLYAVASFPAFFGVLFVALAARRRA